MNPPDVRSLVFGAVMLMVVVVVAFECGRVSAQAEPDGYEAWHAPGYGGGARYV